MDIRRSGTFGPRVPARSCGTGAFGGIGPLADGWRRSGADALAAARDRLFAGERS